MGLCDCGKCNGTGEIARLRAEVERLSLVDPPSEVKLSRLQADYARRGAALESALREVDRLRDALRQYIAAAWRQWQEIKALRLVRDTAVRCDTYDCGFHQSDVGRKAALDVEKGERE